MKDVTRREVIGTAAVGAVALGGVGPSLASGDDKPVLTADEKLDRERVLACGFTEAEADCWVALGRAAAQFLALPKLHVMDDHEIAHAIHVLQYRLMSRPAYRKYRTPPGGQPGEKK
jgi:hypothetical protein